MEVISAQQTRRLIHPALHGLIDGDRAFFAFFFGLEAQQDIRITDGGHRLDEHGGAAFGARGIVCHQRNVMGVVAAQ